MMPLVTEVDVRAVLPTIRVPTLVVHHTDDAIIPPAKGKYIAEHIPDAKYVELPGRNWYHIVEPGWRPSFQEIAEFLTGHQPKWPTIGFSPPCCSPTSWTRRAGRRRSATVTGMRCLMRTTPSCGRSLLGFGAAR